MKNTNKKTKQEIKSFIRELAQEEYAAGFKHLENAVKEKIDIRYRKEYRKL